MKKLKSILMILSSVFMISTFSVSTAYADILTQSYEVGSEEYIEYCNDMTKVPYEENLGTLLNAGINQNWHNVYYAPMRNDETFIDDNSDIKYGNVNEYMIEIDDTNNTDEKDCRRFIGIKLYFNQLFDMDGKGGVLTDSIESINSFLSDNGYDAKVELNSLNEGWIDRLYITYGEEVDTEGMTDILYSLYNEFGLEPFTYITYGSIVASGADTNDAAATDVIDVRTCAYIASALANGNVSELEEALDFNDDGTVNIRDAAAIASFLAKGN